MSGILKSIGRAVKKVFKSKIFKAVLIAAAIYFTAGVGLAAMGSTFAAAMPGITAVGQAIGLAGVGAIAETGAMIAAGVTAAATAGIEVGATMGGMGLEAGIGGAAAATGSGAVAAASGVTASAAGTVLPTASIWGGVTPTAKSLIVDGVVGMGKTVLSAWGKKGETEQREKEFEFHKTTREVPQFSPTPVDIKMPSITERPSIINAGITAAQEGAGLAGETTAGRQLNVQPQAAPGAPQPAAPQPPTGAAPFDPNRLQKSRFTRAGA